MAVVLIKEGHAERHTGGPGSRSKCRKGFDVEWELE